MDFGKFKYEQNKKAQKAKKKQHITHLKEVKLRQKIEEHDYNFKVNHGKNFLEEHDKVKFTVTFRGRELAHPEAGMRLLERVIKDLDGIGVVEIPIRMEGRSMVLLMVPKAQAGKPAEKKPAEKKPMEKKPASGVPTARSAAPRAPSAGVPAATSATKPKP
jgi:translation initiation factor IF-3